MMHLALLRFGAACAGSLVFAFVLAALLGRAVMRWPALAAHRSVWLLAQAAVALVVALACVPLPHGSATPALVVLAAPLDTPAGDTSQPREGAAGMALKPPPPAAQRDAAGMARRAAARLLPRAWMIVYLAGLAWVLIAHLRNGRRWRRLLARRTHAVDAEELRRSVALSSEQRECIARLNVGVLATDLPVSPMLLGVARPRLVLPAHLSALDADQQRLIVEHELTHLRRADPAWLRASAALDAVFWFNRPVRRLGARLRDAVELGCDDAVLAGRSAAERQGYAAALVAQLRLQLQWRGPGCAPAFGANGLHERVARMRAARPPRLSLHGRLLFGAGLLSVLVAGVTLQPAFSAAAVPRLAPTAARDSLAPAGWRYPLAQVRVTALYGVRVPSVPQGIHGVDFAARRGTNVAAVAEGVVAEAASDPVRGRYVRVDHGGGVSSLLAHLERIDVQVGQRVAAGERLGTAGCSGRATGPHLHLQYLRDGRRLDPAIMLPDLEAHATPAALKRRRDQGDPVPADL